jgi:hypothetical protein
MQVTEADVCYVYEAVLHVTLVDTVHKQLLWHTSHPVDGALQGFPLRVLLQVQYLLVLHTSILDRCGNCTHVLECSVSFHSPCPFTAPLVSAPHPPPPTHPPPPHPSLAPGYGITCVLEDGNLLEKAAANISVVRGTLSPGRAQAMSSRGRATTPSAPYLTPYPPPPILPHICPHTCPHAPPPPPAQTSPSLLAQATASHVCWRTAPF